MGVRNWKRAVQDREEWRGLIREAKARYRGCCAIEEEDNINLLL
jgi:hypothetical protein